MENSLDIGKKLVSLCQQGKNLDAVEQLYAPNIVSIEPHEGPDMPARQEGIKAVKAKNEWWYKNHQIHSHEVKGPWANGDQFIVYLKYDVTGTGGPMKGKRMTVEENALYTVQNGKIVQEEFFYNM
jgi:ketosteroid isomerase-like protein